MNSKQLKEIISAGENQEVEFKESFGMQKISKAICSFTNTQGGIIIFGVKDNGEILGIKQKSDDLQKQISSSSQNISPSPLISIESHKVDKREIVVAIIQRAIDGSYCTYEGAIYARVGSTTKKLEGQTHLDFLRDKQILSFDESFESLAKIGDLSKEKIASYLKERGQKDYLESHSIEDFLLSKKLARKNGKLNIKNATVLLFSKDISQFIEQAEIKLVKFKGNEPVEIIDNKLIKNTLPESIEESLNFVKRNISKKIKIKSSPKRETEYEYPLSVIREAVVNAIAHRNYFSKDAIQIYIFDNRIEITSPGTLPLGLSKDLFGTISVQRNPLSYRVLRDFGYVEGLGTGIPRMKNRMRQSGLIDPSFLINESFFRVSLLNQKGKKSPIESISDLNENQKKAIDYLKRNKTIKSSTYSEINKVSSATSVKQLNELVEFRYLKKIGQFRGAYYILNR